MIGSDTALYRLSGRLRGGYRVHLMIVDRNNDLAMSLFTSTITICSRNDAAPIGIVCFQEAVLEKEHPISFQISNRQENCALHLRSFESAGILVLQDYRS
jgi:hypothetical protein